MLSTHLFIYDIKRQNTQAVELLLTSSRANRVEGAAESENLLNLYTKKVEEINPCLVTVGKTVHIGFGISVLENWS